MLLDEHCIKVAESCWKRVFMLQEGDHGLSLYDEGAGNLIEML